MEPSQAGIEDEKNQSVRLQELVRKIAKECPLIWRWGDGDGGAVLNAIYDAFEAEGIRSEPQQYNPPIGPAKHVIQPSRQGEPGQTLYRFFNRGGQLLYVGITDDVFKRWRQHSVDKPWFGEVSRFERDWYPDRDSVLAAEKHAIITEKPKYNIIHGMENRGAGLA